jgi:hypothetical protein
MKVLVCVLPARVEAVTHSACVSNGHSMEGNAP